MHCGQSPSVEEPSTLPSSEPAKRSPVPLLRSEPFKLWTFVQGCTFWQLHITTKRAWFLNCGPQRLLRTYITPSFVHYHTPNNPWVLDIGHTEIMQSAWEIKTKMLLQRIVPRTNTTKCDKFQFADHIIIPQIIIAEKYRYFLYRSISILELFCF